MPNYLVEAFLPRGAAGERRALEERARAAAEAQTRAGTSVRFSGSIHVPEDEICFYAFEAPAAGVVAVVADQAGLRPLRVVVATGLPTVQE